FPLFPAPCGGGFPAGIRPAPVVLVLLSQRPSLLSDRSQRGCALSRRSSAARWTCRPPISSGLLDSRHASQWQHRSLHELATGGTDELRPPAQRPGHHPGGGPPGHRRDEARVQPADRGFLGGVEPGLREPLRTSPGLLDSPPVIPTSSA